MQAQGFFDRLDQRLTVSASDDQVRTRVSGTLDLEFYGFDLPAPGLIDSRAAISCSIRGSRSFVDAQLGPAVYFFARSRIDRHFDPTDQGAQIRLDEYALRITPWTDGRLSVFSSESSPP